MKFSPSLRSTGLDPIGQPVRRGPNYVLRAIDDNDREVSVVINARSGDILSVTPVQTASRMPPPRGGVSMGPYERMPPGYIPPGAAAAATALPVADDDDDAAAARLRLRCAASARRDARTRCRVRAMPRRAAAWRSDAAGR